MSYSTTYNYTQTFTATHAKYLGAKVATDLKRMQRFYGEPNDFNIEEYETEIIELLKKGYIKSISYGFKYKDKFIEPTLKYTAQDLAGMNTVDDDPGKIRPGADIDGAFFYSYLTYSNAWSQLTVAEQESFESQLPIRRLSATEPGVNGYMSQDLTYSSGGQSLNRSIIKSY